MFIEERHQAILAILEEKGSITTAQIQQRFSVGYDSAKRDLRILEEKGLLTRTHGGAIPVGAAPLTAAQVKRPAARMAHPEEDPKSLAIVRHALSLIADGDTIFLPPDSLGVRMVSLLPNEKPVRIVTNSILLAGLIRTKEKAGLLLLGGEADADGACFGGFALEMLTRIRFDKCFLASEGISAEFGLSLSDSAQIPFYNAVLKASRKKIGLYPSDRIGTEASLSIAPAGGLDAILTDEGIRSEERDALREAGAKIIICGGDEDF